MTPVLAAQAWLCGGSVEVVPCSRVAHIERAHKPYAPDLNPSMRRNALRLAEIWLDEYKKNVFIAWNVPLKVRKGQIHFILVNEQYYRKENKNTSLKSYKLPKKKDFSTVFIDKYTYTHLYLNMYLYTWLHNTDNTFQCSFKAHQKST